MTRLYDILSNLAERTRNDVEYVEDTRVSDTAILSGTCTVVSLVNGTRIAFHTQYNVSSDASMILTLKDGTVSDAVPVYKYGAVRFSNFSFAGAILPMTFVTPYLVQGVEVANAAWVLDGGGTAGDIYSGEYVVTPTFELQSLDTGGKVMDEDVMVREIQVHKNSTTGTSGFTVSIPG